MGLLDEINREKVSKERALYQALLSFAYLSAGELDIPTGINGRFLYPEDLNMVELLEIALKHFKKSL